MPTNPHESLQAVEKDNRPLETVAVPISENTSVLVVAMAGIVGEALFIAIWYGLEFLMSHSFEFHAALIGGIAAVLVVLTLADGQIQRQRPAWRSAVLGMLLVSPIALACVIGLGLLTFWMSSNNIPGAMLMGLLAFFCFFVTLSLGGWVAICRTRRSGRG